MGKNEFLEESSNKIPIYDKIAIVIFILSFLGYSSLSFMVGDMRIPWEQYEVSYMFFAKHIVEENSLIYLNPLNRDYTPIFVPNYFIQVESVTLPYGFLGFTFLLAIFYFISSSLIYFVGPVMGVIGLFFLYKLSSLIFNKRIALVSIILFSVFPAYFYNSNLVVADIPAFTFLVGGLFYFIKMLNNPNTKANYILSSLFFALAIWIRYPHAILLITLLPTLYSYRKKLNIEGLLIGAIVFFSFLSFSFFALNYTLYGGPFNLGIGSHYEVLPPDVVEKSGISSIGLLTSPYLPSFNFKILFQNILAYIIILPFFLLLLSIVGIIINFRSYKDKIQRNFTTISLLMSLLLIFYYGGDPTFYGSGTLRPSIESSFLRYFLPVYAFMAIYASVCITKLKNKRILMIFCFVFIVTSISMNYSDYMSPIDRGSLVFMGKYRMVEDFQDHMGILQTTEKNSVIFCKYNDWLIFPDRNVANYLLIPKEKRVDEVTKLVDQLTSDGIPVYFLQEDWYWIGYRFDVYFEAFKNSGLNIAQVYKFKRYSGVYRDRPLTLYKITKGESYENPEPDL